MPLFLFIFIFYNIHTFIQPHSYNTFIHCHSLRPLSISSSLVCSVGKTSLWCRAENRTRTCLTASRRATNYATPHHYYATPHHTMPRRTLYISYVVSAPACRWENSSLSWSHEGNGEVVSIISCPSEESYSITYFTQISNLPLLQCTHRALPVLAPNYKFSNSPFYLSVLQKIFPWNPIRNRRFCHENTRNRVLKYFVSNRDTQNKERYTAQCRNILFWC